MPDHLAAIALLQQGKWQEAHALVQEDKSSVGCWLHGIVHILEGDLSNARYWYQRARRNWPALANAGAELAALRLTLGSDADGA
jgi:hypothetical protein